MANKKKDGDGEVGYGKPPVRTRFSKGQSGNLKGRPRGAKNLATIVRQQLNARLQVRENGRVRTITAKEGLIAQLVHAGLRGNLRAIELMFKVPLLQKELVEHGISRPLTLEDWEQIAVLVRGDLNASNGSTAAPGGAGHQPDISEVASRLEQAVRSRC
jgi:Family of unknown function (DUF5681)